MDAAVILLSLAGFSSSGDSLHETRRKPANMIMLLILFIANYSINVMKTN